MHVEFPSEIEDRRIALHALLVLPGSRLGVLICDFSIVYFLVYYSCVLTTIDPSTGIKHPESEPLRTLKKYLLIACGHCATFRDYLRVVTPF